MTRAEIMNIFGYSEQGIHKLLREHGVRMHNYEAAQCKYSDPDNYRFIPFSERGSVKTLYDIFKIAPYMRVKLKDLYGNPRLRYVMRNLLNRIDEEERNDKR